MRSIILASVLMTPFVSAAAAQPFMEFHVQGVVDDSVNDRVIPVDFQLVFDTAAPPSRKQGDVIYFDAISAESIHSTLSAQLTPIRFESKTLDVPLAESMIYNSSTGVLVLASGSQLFGISHPVGPFSGSMTSLPGDPMDYALDTGVPTAVFALTADTGVTITWNLAAGFTDPEGQRLGAFTIAVRLVDDPNNSCIADLNNDGALNFLDVSHYLQLYGAGCD